MQHVVLWSHNERTDPRLVDIYFQGFRDYLRFNESDARWCLRSIYHAPVSLKQAGNEMEMSGPITPA